MVCMRCAVGAEFSTADELERNADGLKIKIRIRIENGTCRRMRATGPVMARMFDFIVLGS